MVNADEERAKRRGHGPRVLTAALLVLLLLGSSCASFAKSGAFAAGRTVGVVPSDSLTELSGIAASRRNPGVLYVHNDSGDAPRIYALNEKAQLLGACNIQGAGAYDWEDIAVAPGPDPNQSFIYIGDIGDNAARRPEIIVYRVPEPKLDAATPFASVTIGPADVLRLTFPDGPRDAETLIVDPLTRDIYIISKRELVPKVYRVACPQPWHTGPGAGADVPQVRLEAVAVMPFGLFPTGGDVSPDGRRVVVRGVFGAALWERPANQPLWHAFSGKAWAIPLASEPQGEAICFDCRSRGYFTISEGKHPSLHYSAPAEPNSPGR